MVPHLQIADQEVDFNVVLKADGPGDDVLVLVVFQFLLRNKSGPKLFRDERMIRRQLLDP